MPKFEEDAQCNAMIRFGNTDQALVAQCHKSAGHRRIGTTQGHQANVDVQGIFGDVVVDKMLVEVTW